VSVHARTDGFQIVFYSVAFLLAAAGFWTWYFFT
jgi:hypothetical protein